MWHGGEPQGEAAVLPTMERALAYAQGSRSATPRTPIAFLDRDGVINLSVDGHVSHPDQVRLIPGAASSIARLRREGMAICIVTNQSGVGRGWTSETAIHAIHDRLTELLLEEDCEARLDLTLTCPHTPWHGCGCRKPESGLLRLGAHLIRTAGWKDALRGRMDLPRTDATQGTALDVMVGDRQSDLLAGRGHGARSFRAPRDLGLQPVLNRLLDHKDRGDGV